MKAFNVYYRSPITGRLCRYSAQGLTKAQAIKQREVIRARLKVAAKVGAH